MTTPPLSICTNWFGRLRAQLDLQHVRLHDIRHFMATALGQSGTPVATISARLGHRDKATTLNLHSHAIPAADVDAANFMGSLLGPLSAFGDGGPRQSGRLYTPSLPRVARATRGRRGEDTVLMSAE